MRIIIESALRTTGRAFVGSRFLNIPQSCGAILALILIAAHIAVLDARVAVADLEKVFGLAFGAGAGLVASAAERVCTGFASTGGRIWIACLAFVVAASFCRTFSRFEKADAARGALGIRAGCTAVTVWRTEFAVEIALI